METDLKQLRCGSCGEEKHRLYTKDNKIYVQCYKCCSISILSVSQPKINIDNHSGDGTITVF